MSYNGFLFSTGFLILAMMVNLMRPGTISAQDSAPMKPSEVVERYLRSWRSADHHIEGHILQREAEIALTPELKRNLRDLPVSKLIEELLARQGKPWFVSQADVEHMLKMRQLSCHAQNCTNPYVSVGEATPFHRDEVVGAEAATLAPILAQFANPGFSADALEVTYQPARLFSIRAHKLTAMSLKSMIDNDAYAFTVAAILYELDLHKMTAVFENVSRGADAYPYMIAGGQDEAIDILEYARFTRSDVEIIRKYVSQRIKVSDGFYDWLLNWRFRGNLRMVPVGTVIFPGVPVNQIISDPASAILVESLINPWMSTESNLLTTAVMNVLAAHPIKRVSEAGTRRLVTGALSARTGLMGGASSTSNLMVADLLDAEAYGTLNHALVSALTALNGDGVKSMAQVLGLFKGPGLVLPDTGNMLDGIRDAVLGGGDLAATFRQDSSVMDRNGAELPAKEGVQALIEHWTALGRGTWDAVLTNDLTEASTYALAKSGVPVGVVSMGGAFATSSRGVPHGNFVYKLVELRNGPEIFFPIKVANKSKSTEPGEKHIYRIISKLHGRERAVRDIKTYVGEPANLALEDHEEARALIVDGFVGTKRVYPRAGPKDTVPYIAGQIGLFDPAITKPLATRTSLGANNYQVVSSAKLQEIRRTAAASVSPKKVDRHLYVVQPSAQQSYHEEQLVYDWIGPIIAMLKDSANPNGPAQVNFVSNQWAQWPTQQFGAYFKDKFTNIPFRDLTLDEWEQGLVNIIQHRDPKLPPIDIALNKADFDGLLRKSLDNPELGALLHGANFFVAGQSNLYHDLDAQNWRAFGFNATTDGLQSNRNSNVSVYYVNPKPLIEAKLKLNNQLGYLAILHFTDPQVTFRWLAANHPDNGSLAVKGTSDSVYFMTRVLDAAVKSGVFKTSFSGDAHLEAELRDAKNNGEFHAPTNFPRHGMKGETGPTGDGFIPEVAETISAAGGDPRMISVPAHEEAANGSLEVVRYSLDALGADLRDPKTYLRFDKNGPGSYNVASNPRYMPYVKHVDPMKSLPHFHLGWCTDFCDYSVMRTELLAGYQVIFIYDAAAGVGKKTTGARMRELLDLGLVLVSSEQFVAIAEKWAKEKANAATVQTDMYRFSTHEAVGNKAKVLDIISAPEFADPLHEGDLGEQCALLFKP